MSTQPTGGAEVDDVIRDLKKIPGFSAYAILNNDGNKNGRCYVLFIIYDVAL